MRTAMALRVFFSPRRIILQASPRKKSDGPRAHSIIVEKGFGIKSQNQVFLAINQCFALAW